MNVTHFESLYPEDTRYKEIEQILGFIKAGNSCQVVGMPGVGRANLLQSLSYNRAIRTKHLGENQKLYHFVTVNFLEIRKKPLVEVLKFLLITLVDSLENRKMEMEHQKAQEILKQSLSYNDELMVFGGLKKVIDMLCLEYEYTVVLLFERFETYLPMLSDEFFSHLHSLRSRAKFRFSVVFSLQRPLRDIMEPQLLEDFYEYVANNVVYISFFDEPGLSFRIAYLEKALGKTISQETKKQLLLLTAGHVKLTRLSLELLLSSDEYKGKTEEELETYLLSQKAVLAGLYEIWHYLTPEEQAYVLTLSKSKDANTSQNIDYLVNIGLIKNEQITIPLFTAFVKDREKPDVVAKEANELFVFDPTTNEIKKGKEIVSDKLTSLEFRLLVFLLENKGRILERDSLINAVWKDSATTQGVTDQALDQLIFRLRKKIEPNPNS